MKNPCLAMSMQKSLARNCNPYERQRTKIHQTRFLPILMQNLPSLLIAMTKPLLFPFGSNLSQFQAVKNAFTSQISVIEGPPGTGKTQTILNLIANLLYHDKSVAIVSNNNSAIHNVLEKLSDFHIADFVNGGINLGSICAMLGKKENKENFITNQNVQELQKLQQANIDFALQGSPAEIDLLNEKLQAFFTLQNTIRKILLH